MFASVFRAMATTSMVGATFQYPRHVTAQQLRQLGWVIAKSGGPTSELASRRSPPPVTKVPETEMGEHASLPGDTRSVPPEGIEAGSIGQPENREAKNMDDVVLPRAD